MLPRLISPQFGFFDDARTLSQSQKFLSGDFSMSHDLQAGRFRPLHWLYFAFIYLFAGYHPFWYFLGNLFLLFILLIEIRALIKKMGGTEWQILLTSLVFLLSMPLIENFYTLSKGEPLQLTLLLAGVLTLPSPEKPKKSPIWVSTLLATLCFLLANMVKETAVAMVPITFLWAMYLTLTKDSDIKNEQKWYWSLFAASVIATLLYFGLRAVFGVPFLTGGTYANRYLVDLGALLQKALRWTTQLAFYFHYMIPLILLLVVLIINKSHQIKERSFEIFKWGIWWILWIMILVPWEYAELYYLLPFAFGSAFLIGIASNPILDTIRRQIGRVRVLTIILSVMGILLFLLTLPNYRTDAKTQLTFDKINAEMLSNLVKVTPNDATIYLNVETSNEYSEKVEAFLRDHYQKSDLEYSNLNAELMDELLDHTGAFVAVPSIDNQPNLTVRAGVEEAYQKPWNEKFLENTEGHRQLIGTYQDAFRLSNINLPALLCPLGIRAGFCADPDPIFDFRTLTYGWEIYRIR